MLLGAVTEKAMLEITSILFFLQPCVVIEVLPFFEILRWAETRSCRIEVHRGVTEELINWEEVLRGFCSPHRKVLFLMEPKQFMRT